MRGFPIYAVILFLVSCSVADKRDQVMNPPGIFYVNIDSVYSFLLSNDPEAKQLETRKKSIMKSQSREGSSGHEGLELEDIDRRELIIKERLLKEIEQALKKLARERNIDFVFNIGDGLLYGESSKDITEDLIRMILKLRKRGRPVSR